MFDVNEYVTLKNKAESKRQKAEERPHHFSKGRFIKPCKSQPGEQQNTKTVSSMHSVPTHSTPGPTVSSRKRRESKVFLFLNGIKLVSLWVLFSASF